MAVWLDAWHDPVAAIHTTSSCIRLADVTGDGDPKLLVADQNRTLRLYKGMNLISEHALLDTPSAICAFNEEVKGSSNRVPSLAVACGQFIFIYKRLRPHYKFTLPAPAVNELEASVWRQVAESQLAPDDAYAQLAQLREGGTEMTHQSVDYLALEDPAQRPEFIANLQTKVPSMSTTITCMECINKSSEEEGSTTCLVVGTEHKQVVILDASGFAIMVKVSLPSVPVFIATSGLLDIEYRLVVACRNGVIHVVKNGQLLGTTIELEAHPCAMIMAGKNIMVGCTQDIVHSFHLKGKKNYALHQPAAIQAMENMDLEKQANTSMQLVSLSNGEVRLYKEKALMGVIQMNGGDVVTAMRFGRYAREDNALLLTCKSGALGIKLLSRNSNLNKSKVQAGPPPEQDIPLNVPKKTKLYVEQTQRERDSAVDMHRIFQRDLCKLRLNTARAYVKVLTDGQGPVSFSSTASMRLNAEVQGLGPSYKIIVTLHNTGNKTVSGCRLLAKFNASLYKIPNALEQLPAIVPGPQYRFEIATTFIERAGGCEAIHVCVCNQTSAVPVLSAVINMPYCDPIEE